jgi:cis-3-alkyl-4-acyloxetan-2-one decarboxylase
MSPLPPPPLPDWLADQLPFARQSVAVGDYPMHVMSSGDGPAVLMLHGNPTWGYLWRKVAAALAGDGLRLVLPDLVGLGLSGKPTRAADHTIESHATWLARLVEALALDRFVFVGHDWGGPIGLRLLADQPERAAGLVLLNTVAGPPREGSRPTPFHRFAALPLLPTLVFRGLGFPQRHLERAQGDPASIRGAVARAYAWPLRGWRRNVAPLALARLVPTTPGHPSLAPLRRAQGFVEAFRGPSAIVWGDRDPILGRALGRLSRLLPDAVVTHTRGGHFLQEEVPEAIAGAVRAVAAAAYGGR